MSGAEALQAAVKPGFESRCTVPMVQSLGCRAIDARNSVTVGRGCRVLIAFSNRFEEFFDR